MIVVLKCGNTAIEVSNLATAQMYARTDLRSLRQCDGSFFRYKILLIVTRIHLRITCKQDKTTGPNLYNPQMKTVR